MRFTVAVALLLACLLAACDSPTGPEGGTYALVSVDGAPLPAEIKPTFVDRLFVISGTLAIDAHGTYEYTLMRGGLDDPKGHPVYERGVFSTKGTTITLTPSSYYEFPGGNGGELPHTATFRGGNVDIVEQGRESTIKHIYSFKRTS